MNEAPFPPSGRYLQSIRESTQKLCDSSKIAIDSKNIEHLLLSDAFSTPFGRVTTLPGVALPLKFASPLDELNVLSILALLNFGSSFDAPLRDQTGHGASNAIRALLFSMYLSSNPSEGDLLSAQGMQTISATKVAELMGVNVHVEKPHTTLPGVTLGELGGPGYLFVNMVTGVLNETGTILQSSGYPNLGFLVVEALKEGNTASSTQTPSPRSESVIEKLSRALPGFRDMATIDGEPVYIFSKAIFLLNVISTRFGSISPPPFPIPEVKDLPVSADGTNSWVLARLGIVNIFPSPTLKNIWPTIPDPTVQTLLLGLPQEVAVHSPNQEGPSINLEQAFRLRAAAVAACARFLEVANSNEVVESGTLDITLPQINIWLQVIVKERSDYRALGGIITQENVFF